jgi:hypothetical protein
LGLHKPQKEFTDFIEAFALLKSWETITYYMQ